MEKLGENMKKLLLAGIGSVAVTAEKSKELLDEMVKKGELTVEQGKAMNQELKHNLKKKVLDHVEVKIDSPDDFDLVLSKMTKEELEQLKAKIEETEKKNVKTDEKE